MSVINRYSCTGVLALVVLLAGCATPPLYDWGNYETALYQQYNSGSMSEQARADLEKHVLRVEQGESKVAPGLFAELGTLYLLNGDYPAAQKFYEKEATLWPESKVLMNRLIKAVSRRQNSESRADTKLVEAKK